MLALFRVLQGLSAGGEWGGAALIAVEHAPPGRRGFYGAFAQLGTPAGLILSATVFFTARSTMSEAAFTDWGWRIPFLLSAVLVAVGLYIRLRVVESPVFTEIRREDRRARVPILEVLRHQPRELLIATGTFLMNNTLGYVFIVYLVSYISKDLGLPQSQALAYQLAGGVVWLVTTLWYARLSDTVGRRPIYVYGALFSMAWAFPLFLLMETGNAWLILAAQCVHVFALSASYAPTAALFTELFRPEWRYSGASLAYSAGAVLGGGFAPLIAVALVSTYGTPLAISAYLVAVCVIGLAASLAIPRGLGRPG